MKILVLCDIHGDMKSLDKVLNKAGSEFDLIICPGDFTDMFDSSKDFDQLDVAEVIMQKMLALKKPLLCLPGNHDPYELVDIFHEYGVNLHDKHVNLNNLEFVGFGGAMTPFNTLFEPDEIETKESLEKNSKTLKDFVLVTHMPPKDTKLDKIQEGKHVGSEAVKTFIEQKQPLLAISAHIHESAGIDKIKNSTLFFPGPVYEGKYGIVTIDGKTVKCEIGKV